MSQALAIETPYQKNEPRRDRHKAEQTRDVQKRDHVRYETWLTNERMSGSSIHVPKLGD
jgi:hypothetical protein